MYRKCLVFLFIISFAASCGGGEADLSNGSSSGKENKIMETSLYPVLYADRRKSSYMDLSSSAKGIIGWSKLLNEDTTAPFNASALLMTDKHIVIYSDDEIQGLSIDGKKLWTREYWPSSPVSIFADRVYYRKPDQINELGAALLGGGAMEKQMYILNSTENSYPFYIEPFKDDFIAVSFDRIARSQGPSRMVVYRKPYEEMEYAWISEIEGPPALLPLDISELEKLVIFSETEIIVFNSITDGDDGDVYKRFDKPVTEINACSADKEGHLYILSGDDDKLTLTVISVAGETEWQWSAPMPGANLPESRPPILGVENKVHILTDDSVFTVKAGELLWTLGDYGQAVNYGTALSDGTLLIVAGNQLYRLADNGEVMFRVTLDYQITAPPVIDADGNIYVVSANAVTQIK